jgi:hypothetical protein
MVTMQVTYLFALSVAHPENTRMSFPNLCLQTITFEDDKPYMYLCDET